MNYPRTVHILIALVLACPYFCMGDALGSPSTGCSSGCCCPQNDPGQESPGAPAGNDGDCLCRGAVVDTEAGTADLDFAASLTWIVADVAGSTHLVLSNIVFELPHHFPPFSTGRDVCALTCTFLI